MGKRVYVDFIRAHVFFRIESRSKASSLPRWLATYSEAFLGLRFSNPEISTMEYTCNKGSNCRVRKYTYQ